MLWATPGSETVGARRRAGARSILRRETGEPLPLSLDLRLQYILREELQRVIDDFTAKGGAGLIMDVNSGEILAITSLPDFDPNRPTAPDPAHPGISLP